MVAWVCMIQELYFGPHIMGHHGTWLRGQGQLMANLDMSKKYINKQRSFTPYEKGLHENQGIEWSVLKFTCSTSRKPAMINMN